MNDPSEEQYRIIKAVKNGHNVVVDACAGSGKSTTILSAALQMPEKRFLQITYNSSLRKEVKEKVKELGIKNIIVHTYHSLAVAKYTPLACTDTGIRRILYEKMRPSSPILPQDIVVLDESQDMTMLYYAFIVKFIKDMNIKIQMMILGDYKQGLYEFKGADIRFLTNARDIWKDFPYLHLADFQEYTLKTSYRITRPMADFVNKVMLEEDRLLAIKEGDPVVYIRNCNHVLQNTVVFYIKNLIANGVSPNEIFVLGASVKGPNSQIRRIENALVYANIPCYVPMFETDKIDERVMEGKVVFSTFHCVKGRQRAYVFVVGFDQSYLKYFAGGLSHDECPNTLYVACTRATKKMFLLETDQYMDDRPLSFLRMSHHEMQNAPFVEFKGHPRTIFYENEERNPQDISKHYTTPTDLLKFIPESVLEDISPLLSGLFVQENTEEDPQEIPIPILIKTKMGFYEDVSDLNGIAIPAIFYDYVKSQWNTKETGTTQDKPILYEIIEHAIENVYKNTHHYLHELFQELPTECNTVSDYLYMANMFVAIQEKLYFKLRQIQPDEYTWLTPSILYPCKVRLSQVLEKECALSYPQIETTVIHKSDEEMHANIDTCLSSYFPQDRFRFTARADLITENVFWEIKCTSTISSDHQLQLIIYAWILLTIDPEYKKEFKLFNIKTGEIMVLKPDKSVLDTIMVKLLEGKYRKQEIPSTETFLEDCKKYVLL